jgi:hypothetical protein
MPISDYTMFEAWMKALTLSRLTRGQILTIFAVQGTHSQPRAFAGNFPSS